MLHIICDFFKLRVNQYKIAFVLERVYMKECVCVNCWRNRKLINTTTIVSTENLPNFIYSLIQEDDLCIISHFYINS